MTIFHVVRQGHIGNQMFQYLVAKKLQKFVPDMRISNVVMPDWGIDFEEIKQRGRIFDYSVEQYFPFRIFTELFSRNAVDCVQYSGFGQRIENIPHREEAKEYFRRTDVSVKGYSSEHLVINIRGGEVLDGRHPGYVLAPIDFYQNIVILTGLRPVFMGQVEENRYCEALKKAFPSAIFIPSQGAINDFELIRRSVNVIPAVSTFSWLACWLSETVNSVFMPMTGIFNSLHYREHDFTPTDDQRFRFFWFPANYSCPVADYERNHKPLNGRFREIDPVDLARLKQFPYLRPKILADFVQYFDENFYINAYDDVRRAIDTGLPSGFYHYITHGFRENRRGFAFNSHWYVRTYPEAADDIGLGRYEDEIHHFVSVGAKRSYRPVPTNSA